MTDFAPTQPSAAAGEPDSEAQVLEIRFTGSGSEYFRIWLVNTLLIVITLSFYYPWAKVRRLRYFHGNTLVGGHPMDFHGNPKTMLRGFLLVGAMLLLYSLAGRFSPMAGLVAFCIFAALWPALMRASLQFRLANTSWRGLRFRFTGDLSGAYAALLPLFVPALLFLAPAAFAEPTTAGQAAMGKWLLLVMALSLILLPLLMFRLKRYQHGHYAIADQQTALQTGAGSFYAVCLKTFGVVLLTGLVASLLVGAPFVWFNAQTHGVTGGIAPGKLSPTLVAVSIYAAFATVYAAIFATAGPYYATRMQNLLWSRTDSADLRFDSRLRFWPMVRLAVKNLVLIVITLGLYWPFAKVAAARMRLEAVSVTSTAGPDALTATERLGHGDASGDAAGDLFGFDIGL